MTPKRAKEVFAECKKTAGCGPWSDQLRNVMTEDETDYVLRLWQSDQYPGSASFVTVFFDIMNGVHNVD